VGGLYPYDWFNPARGEIAGTGRLQAAAGKQEFKAPFEGDAVLYLQDAMTEPVNPAAK